MERRFFTARGESESKSKSDSESKLHEDIELLLNADPSYSGIDSVAKIIASADVSDQIKLQFINRYIRSAGSIRTEVIALSGVKEIPRHLIGAVLQRAKEEVTNDEGVIPYLLESLEPLFEHLILADFEYIATVFSIDLAEYYIIPERIQIEYIAKLIQQDKFPIAYLRKKDLVKSLPEKARRKLLAGYGKEIADVSWWDAKDSTIFYQARVDRDLETELFYVDQYETSWNTGGELREHRNIDLQVGEENRGEFYQHPLAGAIVESEHIEGGENIFSMHSLDSNRPVESGKIIFVEYVGKEPSGLVFCGQQNTQMFLVCAEQIDFIELAAALSNRKKSRRQMKPDDYLYTQGVFFNEGNVILTKACRPHQDGAVSSDDLRNTLIHENQHFEYGRIAKFRRNNKVRTWRGDEPSKNYDRFELYKDELLAFFMGDSINDAVVNLWYGYGKKLSESDLCFVQKILHKTREVINTYKHIPLSEGRKRLLVARLMSVHFEEIPEVIEEWFRQIVLRMDEQKKITAIEARLEAFSTTISNWIFRQDDIKTLGAMKINIEQWLANNIENPLSIVENTVGEYYKRVDSAEALLNKTALFINDIDHFTVTEKTKGGLIQDMHNQGEDLFSALDSVYSSIIDEVKYIQQYEDLPFGWHRASAEIVAAYSTYIDGDADIRYQIQQDGSCILHIILQKKEKKAILAYQI